VQIPTSNEAGDSMAYAVEESQSVKPMREQPPGGEKWQPFCRHSAIIG
jgi:hypothetical protein